MLPRWRGGCRHRMCIWRPQGSAPVYRESNQAPRLNLPLFAGGIEQCAGGLTGRADRGGG
ncbi:hypothetical protein FRIGORI9N_470082 [Frigoribacterium sp. 9N]|nr:hypothetical protein FRIGORI9N_470082 [Frigoribacterium sp. 9N]